MAKSISKKGRVKSRGEKSLAGKKGTAEKGRKVFRSVPASKKPGTRSR